MIDEVYIHIGTEKTGTTSIQSYLTQNRDKLRCQGILFPTVLGANNQLRLPAYAMDAGKHDVVHAIVLSEERNGIDDFRKQLRIRLSRELSSFGGHTVVVSSEHCHSRLRSYDEIARLKSLFDGFSDQVKVVVYLRRQDRVALSLFSTAIKCGKTDIDNIFPKINAKQLPYYFNYRQIILQYREVFGDEGVIVRIYEDAINSPGGLISDFSSIIGIAENDLLIPERVNKSLSYQTQLFLAEFNRHVPWLVNGRLNKQRANLVSLLENISNGRGKMPSRAGAKEFYNHFGWTNSWVQRELFTEKTHLFDLDFMEYPEIEAEESISYIDAVEIAAKLWLMTHDSSGM